MTCKVRSGNILMAGQNYAVQIRDRHSLPACDEAEHDGEAGGDVW